MHSVRTTFELILGQMAKHNHILTNMRRLFTQYMFLLFTCASLFSCEDDPCDKPEPHMYFYDLNTRNPVEGVDVNIISYVGNGDRVVEKSVTDGNGYVEWSCVLSAEAISGCKEGYWDACEVSSGLKEVGIVNHIYEMQPKAWVKLHIVDAEPFETNTYVQFRSSRGNVSGVLDWSEHEYYMIMAVVGNSTEPLFANKYHSGEEAPFLNEELIIVASPGDTLEYTYIF
jgi:hypothetical protein